MNSLKLKTYLFNNSIFSYFHNVLNIIRWNFSGYKIPCPRAIKLSVLRRYGIKNAPWVETGTYLGQTTKILSNEYSYVYSIEGQKKLYLNAVSYFKNKSNIKIYYGDTESTLNKVLEDIDSTDINLWLDAHYSSGITYLGNKECPIDDELIILQSKIKKYRKICICVDDVRCFPTGFDINSGYPPIKNLIEWAENNRFEWKIEYDILIMIKDV